MSDDSKKPKLGRNTGNAGKGRPKGSLNKATTEFRETINQLLETNKDNVALWLHQVATGEHGKDPAPEKALDLLAKLAEYAAPKLNRTEHVGDNKNPIPIAFTWKK